MTITNIDLQELLETTGDPDLQRKMIGAQRLIELEIETRTGTARGACDRSRCR